MGEQEQTEKKEREVIIVSQCAVAVAVAITITNSSILIRDTIGSIRYSYSELLLGPVVAAPFETVNKTNKQRNLQGLPRGLENMLYIYTIRLRRYMDTNCG